MAVVYARETPADQLDPVQLALSLSEAVAGALPWLEAVSGAAASVPRAPGAWCPKEVVGHLVDSAVNNLQRFVRLETVLDIEPEVRSQGYEQEAWVLAQNYAEKPWNEVLTLWRVLNEHIAWTMRHVSRHHLGRICVFPESQMTFGFLMEDYVAHLEHHLTRLRLALDA